MSQIPTNISGIPSGVRESTERLQASVKKPANAATQGSTQSTVTNTSGIPEPVKPVPVAAPIDTKPFEPISPISLPTPNQIPEPVQPVQPVPVSAPTPAKPIETAKPIDIPGSKPIPAAIPTPDPTELDFSKATEILKEQKITDVAELQGEVNRREENAFNRLTHDSLALQRDSGFVEAAKTNTIRNANIQRMDGTNSIKSQFNDNMFKLELEKERTRQEKATKDEIKEDEDFRDFLINGQASIEQLYSSDPQAALALGLELAASTEEATPWDIYENEAVAKSWVAAGDRALTDAYNVSTGQAREMVSKLDENTDAVNMNNAKSRLLDLFETNEDLFGMQIRNQFTGMTEDNITEFGLKEGDTTSAAMVEQFMKDGDIGAPGLKDVFLDAYIKYSKNEQRIASDKEAWGPEFNALSDDSSTSEVLNQLVEQNFGGTGSGAINLNVGEDGNVVGLNTFGVAVGADNIADKAGIDYLFTDWDGNAYGGDYNFGSQAANDAPVEGTDFTTGKMNDEYQKYINQKSKEYRTASTENKASIANSVLNQEAYKQSIIDGNTFEGIRGVTSFETEAGATGEFNADTHFVPKDGGEPVSFSSLDVDLNSFSKANREVVKELFSNPDSIHDPNSFTNEEWEVMIGEEPDLIDALEKQGIITSEGRPVGTTVDGKTTANEYNITGENTLLSENDNSKFTGSNGIELYQSLGPSGSGANRSGRMLIDGQLYNVSAVPGNNNVPIGDSDSGTTVGTGFSGNLLTPVINWSLTPVNDESATPVTWTAQVHIGGENLYVKSYRSTDLKKKIIDSIVNNEIVVNDDGSDFYLKYGENVS